MAENTPGTAKRRGPGRPFPKGTSGNPGGRPKAVAEVRELAQRHTATAIQTLVALMQGAKSESARVAAAQAVLDRGWGRPLQNLEATVRPVEPPIDLRVLTDDELAALKAIRLKLDRARGLTQGADAAR